MAVTYGFYNALNHDRVYDALQMSSIFDGIIQNGVFSTIGEALICKASGTGLIVNVGSGRAWFDHTWTLNDTDYPVEAEQAEVVLDRIDAIVLEVNQAVEVRANSIKFVKGTPSSTPVRPTMIHNAEVNQYALAYVSVRAGQTTIFDSDITNVVGTDETPFVTGLLQQLSVEQLLIQWNDDFYRYFNNFKTVSTADFNTFMTNKQTEYAAWYANMQAEGAADLAEFDAWFQHMKDQLDEDAAGHLQAEIDALALQAEKGSIIRVTTPETTLINQTCTITQDLLSRTATFDSHGVADFPSVPMIGDMVITSTDGSMTAIRNVNIPYFGRYEFEIAFWSATLAIHTTSSDLYGRPITIKQGTTTIGTTAFNQQGVASFDVHSAGTYTVSAVTTGGTESTADVVVTEQTTYNVELGSVPEGATVTPTDVISTWIACAGLENTHNYTTLAEVMADTELFDTLLRDSNACDYMARSTTWAKAEGLVPVLSSDTGDNGIVYAPETYNSSYPAWKMYDGDDTTYAMLTTYSTSKIIGYVFNDTIRIGVVKALYAENQPSIGLSAHVEYSDNGTDWTSCSTEHSYAPTGSNWLVIKDITEKNPHRYWRLNISSTESIKTVMYSIQFYADTSIVDDHDAMTRVGLYDYCSEKLLSDATWAEAIAESEYWEEILDSSNPFMTSNTAPSGICSAESINDSGHDAWMAFDNPSNGEFWVGTNASLSHWIQYEFPTPVRVLKGNFVIYEDATLNDVSLQGSNDGTNFTTIKTFNVQGPYSNNNIITFGENDNAYKIYRFRNEQRVGVCEVRLYYRHSSDRYKPLVPVMTSNTTPSGVCIADSEGNDHPAYYAFDSNTSTYWSPSNGVVPNRIGYHFTSAVIINKVKIRPRYNAGSRLKDYIIQGSNDGITWNNIHSGTLDNKDSETDFYIDFANNTAYQYWCIYCSSSYNSNNLDITELQFYSKIPSTTQIHSCPNDTIYHMANGSPVVLATTDANGVGEVDWGELPAGDLVLYSSVAKDPDNLSNDYHKVCTITKTAYGHTTDFYLMPDPVKVAYWYGKKLNLQNPGKTTSSYTKQASDESTNYISVSGLAINVVKSISGNDLDFNKITVAKCIVNPSTVYGTRSSLTLADDNNVDDHTAVSNTGLQLLTVQKTKTFTNPVYIAFEAVISNRVANDVYALWYE